MTKQMEQLMSRLSDMVTAFDRLTDEWRATAYVWIAYKLLDVSIKAKDKAGLFLKEARELRDEMSDMR